MDDTLTPSAPVTCPYCAGPFGSPRAVTAGTSSGPRPGDYAACANCGQVSKVIANGTDVALRKPTADEMIHFMGVHADDVLLAWQIMDKGRRSDD